MLGKHEMNWALFPLFQGVLIFSNSVQYNGNICLNRIQHAESSLSHGFVLFWIMFKNLIMEQADLSFPDELLEFGLVKDR